MSRGILAWRGCGPLSIRGLNDPYRQDISLWKPASIGHLAAWDLRDRAVPAHLVRQQEAERRLD